MRRAWISLLLALSVLSVTHVGFAATILVSPEMPVVETDVWLEFRDDAGSPVAGVPLSATYSPGAELARKDDACTTGADGRCMWQPRRPGIVLVSSDDGAHTVISVKYRAMPVASLLVFLCAGFLLVGGMIFGVRRLTSAKTS